MYRGKLRHNRDCGFAADWSHAKCWRIQTEYEGRDVQATNLSQGFSDCGMRALCPDYQSKQLKRFIYLLNTLVRYKEVQI